MRHNVCVSIPVKGAVSYSLFAQGLLIDIPKDSEDKNYIVFKFSGGTVFALFYTFANFRRAYLATEWESEKDGEATTLPGIDVPLYVLYKAKGRKIDELKHALLILTKKNHYAPFALSIEFWQKLANQIELYGSRKEEVFFLYNKYCKKCKRLETV